MTSQIRELSIDELCTVCGCGIDGIEQKPRSPTPFADMIRDRQSASDTSNAPTTSTSTSSPMPAVLVTFGR